METSLRGGQTASYTATYTDTDNGQSQTVTFAQDPPQFLFKVGQGELIQTHTAGYYCSTAKASSCTAPTLADPLKPLQALVSAQSVIELLIAAQGPLAAKQAGYSSTFSSGTFGGLASSCVTISSSSGSEKFCVTDAGQVAYVSTSGQVITLTRFSNKVNASDFAPPSGIAA
jgi:hypothetical protein